jgi:hypothetical protein
VTPGDQEYFIAVSEHPKLRKVLKKHGFTEVRVFEMRHNAGIWISKPEWLMPNPPVPGASVWVHFEARKPGECRLEVDTHPYVPGIAQKPEQMAELATAIELKSLVLQRLRECVTADPRAGALGASTAALRDPDQPDAGTAVKFLSDLPEDATPAHSAAFIASVMEEMAPVVDRCLPDRPTP